MDADFAHRSSRVAVLLVATLLSYTDRFVINREVAASFSSPAFAASTLPTTIAHEKRRGC